MNFQFLGLAHNNLKEIDGHLFISLTNLLDLYLEGNKLTKLEEGTFTNVFNLQWVDLSFNNLISINRNIFTGLADLEHVYLKANPLSLTQPSFVSQLCYQNPLCTVYV